MFSAVELCAAKYNLAKFIIKYIKSRAIFIVFYIINNAKFIIK